MPTWLVLMEELTLEPGSSADSPQFPKALVSASLCEGWCRHLRGSWLFARPWCRHLREHLYVRDPGLDTSGDTCCVGGRGVDTSENTQ